MPSAKGNIEYIYDSDLLESDSQLIAQQCNCTSKKAKGLAASISKKFPYADFYSSREDDSVPGTIKVVGNKSKKQRFIVAMFAQLNPGKPTKGDSKSQREKWFRECLEKIGKIKSLKSISFPFGIGCGLAGGDWEVYHQMILDWTLTLSGVKVKIISQDPEPEVITDENEEPDEFNISEIVSEHPTVGKVFSINSKTMKKLSKTKTSDPVINTISNLSVGQKMKLFDHLLSDIQDEIVTSSKKIIDDLVKSPEDETWLIADKVIPSPPVVGMNNKIWEEILSQGEYPHSNEVEFFRFVWLSLTGMKAINLNYFIQNYEKMSGRKCHFNVSKDDEIVSDEDTPEDGETVVLEDKDSSSVEEETENSSEDKNSSEEEEETEDDEKSNEISWSTMSLKEYTSSHIPESWEDFFNPLIEDGGLDDVDKFLTKEVKKYTIYPPLDEIYTAFNLCSLSDLKVVVVGQDPYHTKGAAMGVAFGHHSERVKVQPSLRNIYKCLKHDIPDVEIDETSGDLGMWCVQGVLLINTALTVREGEAASHASKSKSTPGIWDYFIGQLFNFLNENCDHLVVVMWGAKAQEYKSYFDPKKHHHISAPHPAASAYNPSNKDFLEHKPFTRINKQLKKWKKEQIYWKLDLDDECSEQE